MLSFRYIKFVLFGIYLAQSLWATTINIKHVPEFIGGLNLQQINDCEAIYSKQCRGVIYQDDKVPRMFQYWECINQKMSKDISCKMAFTIRENIGHPINNLKQYGKITVFSVLTIADGQDVFYIVDNSGQLIDLTSDDGLVKNNPRYLELKEIYPNVSLTAFIASNKRLNNKHNSLYNNFPTPKVNSSTIELIFRQELRDGYCVACKTVGTAYLAYRFNLGKFVDVRLLKVE